MRVVVAGGRGFIGARAVQALAAAGHQALSVEKDEPMVAADAVVWAAGARDSGPEIHVDAARSALAVSGAARFVYLSSGEVYGAQDVPFREGAQLLGASAYARAKIAGEAALAAAARERGVALTVLRLAVVYGPGQSGSMFVPSLIAGLARRQRVPMTRGEQTRDFLEVGDAVALIGRALDGPPGTYNGGSGRELRLADAARAIAAAFGDWAGPLLDVGALPYREREQMRYFLDPSLAAERLGWRARVRFEDGVGAAIRGV